MDIRHSFTRVSLVEINYWLSS